MVAPGAGPTAAIATLASASATGSAEPGAAAAPAPAFAAGLPTTDTAEALPASSQAVAHGAPQSSRAPPAGTAAALAMTAVAPGSPATSTVTAPEIVQDLAGTIADPLGIATSGTTTQPVAQRVQVVPLPPLPMPADPQTGFDDGFGSRIAWVAGQQLGHAEIRLNPEHVGPIDVRVRMEGDQVHTEFHSAHADVRQAIEASLPRLRELLGQHGFHLGQADVGQRDPGQQPRTRAAAPGHDEAGTAPAAPAATAALPRRSHGLLDAYA
ncbi:flagellar hook-length control protein FliK [Luteimonas sp. MJ174]|uniref:flagellar hook-length control protein FliK n=1 Tax=Luteimonas sp. MJ174 TaxID=3129237 RepID=UPI0031BAB168